jgi:DNA-directed RNA polymerase specialized sigma24 family protein
VSLSTVTDRFLAVRAAAGDEAAFCELALRYRPLIGRLTQGPPPGVEVDDLRQEALLGLLDACRFFDPAKGAFAALATVNVRWRVNGARIAARAAKHRILSQAARDGEDRMNWLAERPPAPEGADPAVVVVLRDELRATAPSDRGAGGGRIGGGATAMRRSRSR